ncbi:hypothetical protein Pmar_PMAR028459, partial [Perkinsus marinus ATCC 50983]
MSAPAVPPTSSVLSPSTAFPEPPPVVDRGSRRSSRRVASSSSGPSLPARLDAVTADLLVSDEVPHLVPEAAATDQLAAEINAALFSLRPSAEIVDSIATCLQAGGLVDPRNVQELTREDIELLLPGPERVGARTILRTVTRLLAARLPPSGSAAADPNPPRSGFGTVCHFDLPAALCARHLEGLDGRVIPSSSLLDTVTSNGSAEHLVATIATLELNLSVLGDTTPSHSPEVTPQSLLTASRASTSLAGKPNFRPSAFVPSLVRWCILALLTTNLPLAAVLGHLVWCSKYVELHGPYTAALYDQLHRSAVAASLRAGSS